MKRKTTLTLRLLAALSLVMLSAVSRGQATKQETKVASPSSKVVARIPFELNGNEIFLQLRVNGSRPLWFGLDTGAAGSVINTTTAEALGLKMEGSHQATGAGGQVPSSRVQGVTLDISSAQLKDLTVATIALTPIENAMGHTMDGILGYEFFRRFVVEIDYEKQMLNLHEPASFVYAGRGESLPLSFTHNHPYVRAKIAAPGREPVEGNFVLDTGSNFPLVLLKSFVNENRLADSSTKTLKIFGRGVGGEIMMPVGRTSRLILGSYTLENPVTSFPQTGTFARPDAAGNIGGALLRRFKVTFDYSRSRMYVEPNKNFSEPFEYDMSGIQFVTDSPSFRVFRVNRVLANSPAEEVGLKQGDEIVTFEGRPASEFRLAALREMLRQPGIQYALKVRRGAETLSVALKTRRMI
ncbi:MAG TPA: aspartyl protease family protein [Pyrinomonadaceae bacterium]|nr:aspartyl protease family protein [Pyrinomonadaceae bacterium]